MKVENWNIVGSRGQVVFANTHLPKDNPTGILLVCHGFMGYKDYSFIPTLCDQAAQNGLISVRFNFSHSGVTEDYSTFSREDLFEDCLISDQLRDVEILITDLKGKYPSLPVTLAIPGEDQLLLFILVVLKLNLNLML